MKIVTAVVNNPDFIEIQNHTLKKYFKGDYEFIVFNDAKDFVDFTNDGDITLKQQIENMCKSLNIKCIKIPNDHHKFILSGSHRTADSLNFILEYQKKNIDEYFFIDSDMFLIDNFDISKYRMYQAVFVLQQRGPISYIWPQYYYFNMNIMKDFDLLNWNLCDYCDAGGNTKYWVEKQFHNELPTTHSLRYSKNGFEINNCLLVKHLWSLSWDESEMPKFIKENKKVLEFLETDPRNKEGKFFCEIYDDKFLHYRGGCNWLGAGMQLHINLTKKLKSILMT
jgi:hypothetical protein